MTFQPRYDEIFPSRQTNVFIQDLESIRGWQKSYSPALDLIVCGFNHIEELRNVVPSPPVEAVAVLLQPESA